MDVVLFDAPGRLAKLTTDRPASANGLPVLVLSSEIVCGAFGPTDRVPVVPFPGPAQLHDPEVTIDAATVVSVWGDQGERTDEERVAVRAFLDQWRYGTPPTLQRWLRGEQPETARAF